MTTDPTQILALNDAGHTPAQIAVALHLSAGRVYATLRAHRPDRRRALRRAVSDVPVRVRGLAVAGIAPKRIALLLGCSSAYVYRILKEAAAASAANGERT